MSDVAPSLAPDPARCPLCAADNGCAAEMRKRTGQPQPPCWCLKASFSAELLARIPAAARQRACVCATCARSAAP